MDADKQFSSYLFTMKYLHNGFFRDGEWMYVILRFLISSIKSLLIKNREMLMSYNMSGRCL